MLHADLTASDQFTAHLVKERCSEFGTVVSVTIRRSHSPLAIVQMADQRQALNVAINTGGSVVGVETIIHLLQSISS